MNLKVNQNIEECACQGNLNELKDKLMEEYSQLDIDVALGCAIAYSYIEMAEYLLTLGADFSNYNYDGVYYAAHNNELEGLKFAISKGVDINVRNGMILNTSIQTATNAKSIEMVKWILENGGDVNLLTKQSRFIAETYGQNNLKELIKNYSQHGM